MNVLQHPAKIISRQRFWKNKSRPTSDIWATLTYKFDRHALPILQGKSDALSATP